MKVMKKKFMYVFTKDFADKMIAFGKKPLRYDEKNNVYIFDTKIPDGVVLSKFSNGVEYAFSDVLIF